jgi:hypothetical protein
VSHLKLSINNWGEVVLDKKQLRALMRSAGNDVKSKTARLISAKEGGGRVYRGGGGSAYRGDYKAGRYRASAPGDPPVTVTGTLKRSLRTYAFKNGEGFAVRERAFYSLFQEAGAQGGGNPGGRRTTPRERAQARRHRARHVFETRVLAPRPHLDRVMKQEEANLQRRVRTAMDQGMTWKETKTL